MSFLKELMKVERKSPREHHVYQVANPPPEEAAPDDANTTTEGTTTQETTAGPTEESTTTNTTTTTGTPDESTSLAPEGSDSVTQTPVPAIPMTVTTSMVTSTSMKPSPKAKKSRMSKLEAANQYVYGPKEDTFVRPSMPPLSEMPTKEVRANRAQTMRQSCILKRVKDIQQERTRLEEKEGKYKEEKTIQDPVVARVVPQALYNKPRISVRDTKSSKFRYLYNRKPPGVTVYFKPANADEKKKPPFVVAAPLGCF